MSRFLVRKKGKEKYELSEPRGGGEAGVLGGQGVGVTPPPAANYGSITSLLNNEVSITENYVR